MDQDKTPESDLQVDEILAAEKAAHEEDDPAALARLWLLETHAGTLCTTAARRGLEGYPYGSVVPFALTDEGRPIILIAGIATHTHNLKNDPRGALFVRQPGLEGDPQKGWRITLMGRWAQVPRAESDALHARYCERIPFAEGYLKTHDFAYWRMDHIEQVRYIGGFGKICWLPGDSILRDPTANGIGKAAPGAIEHMNEDHAHNMVEMCTGLHGFTPEGAEMVSLDPAGFLVRTTGPDKLVYFPFGKEITAKQLRVEVVEVLKRARAAT